jgi:hypothetical protein
MYSIYHVRDFNSSARFSSAVVQKYHGTVPYARQHLYSLSYSTLATGSRTGSEGNNTDTTEGGDSRVFRIPVLVPHALQVLSLAVRYS